ncbi:hypothetical protein D3C71_2056590 [compost metagenome]
MVKLPGRNLHASLALLKREQTEDIPFEYEDIAEDYQAILHCFYKTLDGRRVGFKMDVLISAETKVVAITPPIKEQDL